VVKVRWARVDANPPFPPYYTNGNSWIVFWEQNKWYVSHDGEITRRADNARRWYRTKEKAFAMAEKLMAG